MWNVEGDGGGTKENMLRFKSLFKMLPCNQSRMKCLGN
jgi:hypothetical protein